MSDSSIGRDDFKDKRKGVEQSFRLAQLKAFMIVLMGMSSLWNAVLIGIGFLSFTLLFPLYSYMIIPLLLVIFIISYTNPIIGVMISFILIFPAIAYQVPILAWLFLIPISLMFFEVFSEWYMIAALLAIISAPLVPEPFGIFLGAAVIPILTLSSLKLGSKKASILVPIVVFIILLLSSFGQIDNFAFLTISKSSFVSSSDLIASRPTPELIEIPGALVGGLSDFVGVWQKAGTGIGYFLEATFNILFADAGLVQMIGWTLVFFAVAYIPMMFPGGKRAQTIAALVVLLLIPINYLSSVISNVEFNSMIVIPIIVTVAILALMDEWGYKVSAEREIVAEKRRQQFGMAGMVDLSTSPTGPKSLAEVGGYDSTEKELKEAIMMPLKYKELGVVYGIRPPKGVLLFGPPGTGKTLLMTALAKELHIPFYYIKCSEILSQWYGESLPYDEKLLVKDEAGNIRFEVIGKIVEEKLPVQVAAFDEKGAVVFSEVKDYIKHKNTSQIYEVRTRTGRKIRVTNYHSLFTLSGGKLVSVKTSELIPGESYIAIPKFIPQPEKKIENIDFLHQLEKEDYGLKVCGADEYIKKAIEIHGEKECAQLLGLKRVSEIHRRFKDCVGFPIKGFLNLMKTTGVDFDEEKLSIHAHKSSLPALIPINNDFATFLGLWIAEGSYNKNWTVRISISKEELKEALPLCSRFGTVTVYNKHTNNRKESNGTDLYISSRPLQVLLRYILGMKSGAKNKNLPNLAFNLDNERLAALLRGYFSGDGNIHINQHGVGTIEVNTISPHLADEVMYALLRFGIVSRLRIRSNYKPKLNASDLYHISFSGAEDLQRFSQISFIDRDKQLKLLELTNKAQWSRSDQIPVDNWLKTLVKEKLPYRMQTDTIGVNILRSTEFTEDEIWPAVYTSDKGVYFDRVEEIREVKELNNVDYVYDVAVEPCQNFIAGVGGIFAHNSEKKVVELFKTARKNAPCVLFFDEIDTIGKDRQKYQSDETTPRVLSAILTEMDGLKGDDHVIVVGATNTPNVLDSALLRPGRLDKIIYMPPPDVAGRKQILGIYTKKIPIASDVDLDKIAKKIERFTGADIANLVLEAARMAAPAAMEKKKIIPVSMDDFTKVMGTLKPSVTYEMLEDYEQFRTDFERRGVREEISPVEERKVTWDDVVGLDDVRKALTEAIELPLLHEDDLKQFNVKPAKGVLMFGPPGCGKTLIAKAAASELKATFISLTPADISRKGYDNAVSLIKETFNRARENPPTIIFIDEIESITPSREFYQSKVMEDIVAQFLQEMDGMKELKNVILIGATNKPEIIDKALMRPGRFDKIVFVGPPNKEGRIKIFKNYLAGIRGADAIDYEKLGDDTEGYTGADIAGICNEVKLKLVRAKISGISDPSLTQDPLNEAITNRPRSVTVKMLREYLTFVKEYGERR